MDFDQLKEKVVPVLKQYWIAAGLGLIGFVFLLYGLISSGTHKNSGGEILSEAAHSTSSGPSASDSVAGAKTDSSQIAIDVEGAVMKPGVYQLKKDARVQDALIAAGGLSDKADREKVSKGLNLASKITDGGKIYIPFIGDSAPVSGGISIGSGSMSMVSGSESNSSSGLININTASSSQLDSLPGVGSVTSSKIINNRPYGSIDELLIKKIVGASVFEKIKDKVSVN